MTHLVHQTKPYLIHIDDKSKMQGRWYFKFIATFLFLQTTFIRKWAASSIDSFSVNCERKLAYIIHTVGKQLATTLQWISIKKDWCWVIQWIVICMHGQVCRLKRNSGRYWISCTPNLTFLVWPLTWIWIDTTSLFKGYQQFLPIPVHPSLQLYTKCSFSHTIWIPRLWIS